MYVNRYIPWNVNPATVGSIDVDYSKLFSDLVRVEISLWDAVDESLRERHDLPLPWFEPMRVIDRMGGGRVIDIAEELRITVGGTSKLVDRIEGAGYMKRTPDPNDGRAMRIQLTPAGRRKLRAAEKTQRTVVQRFLDATLSSDSQAQLAGVLERLRETQPGEGGG